MLALAVATRAETYERIQDPLAERGIKAEHVQTRKRTIEIPPADDDWAGYDVGFVYPPRLMEGSVSDVLLDVPWVNDREAVLTSRNKAGVIAELAQAGIPVPETVVVSNPVEQSALVDSFEQFEPPVVIKPNSATRGVGIAKAHDLDSFLGIVDYLDLVHDYRATDDQTFLVQEYLPDARDYRVMLVDGEYVGAVERRLPDEALAAGQWKHNVHRGADATGTDLPARLRELAERTANTLDIPWLGVDILVTDNRAVVNETNARPTIDTAPKYEPGFYDELAALIRQTTPVS